MTEQVILVAGLPGSGKTTLLCQMLRGGWLVFDDYKARAFNDCSEFRKSRKFRALISALHDDLRCAVADIDFCKTESRMEAERVLSSEVPDALFHWRFFNNDPSACEANIQSRANPSTQEELKKLREYSPLYRIPQGADVLPVLRNDDQDHQREIGDST